MITRTIPDRIKIASAVLSSCFSLMACEGGIEAYHERHRDEPILALSATPTLERPTEACEADFTLTEGDVFYVLHALPDGVDRNIDDLGQLTITVETACTEITKSVEHDDDGMVSVPVRAPAGSECGAVVTASIANSTKRCTLEGAQSTDCMIECPVSDDTDGSQDDAVSGQDQSDTEQADGGQTSGGPTTGGGTGA